jgi:apolipoprotein N-acyltransferase
VSNNTTSSGSDGKKEWKILLFLAISSGIALSVSFPPSQLGVIVCFAFIPLLLIYEFTDGYARPLRYTYVTFFILQLLTVYWMGGFVHGRHAMQMFGGALLILAHPFFFFIPLLGYLLIRRTFGLLHALIAFPFIWVGFEYIHSIGDLAFPWHTLGNTQSYDLARLQIITVTGVYGLSFWIMTINAIAFYLIMNIATKRWKIGSIESISTAILIIVIHLVPLVYGSHVLSNRHNDQETVRIGLVQPDVDPFMKWDANRSQIIEQLMLQSERLALRGAELIVWPENAIPFYLMLPQNRHYLLQLREFIDFYNVPIITGLPYAIFYAEEEDAPRTAKEIPETGERYASFNAAVLLEPGRDDHTFYGKIVLVPFVEKIPFSDLFEFAVKIRRSIGIGGWDVGPDTTLFSFNSEWPLSEDVADPARFTFGTVICYESVYPGYVRHFSDRGADFLVVITNDSWWGRTPGPRQHLQMSVLRAIENRRSIARAANGGISAFIDPYGSILSETELFTQTETIIDLPVSDEITLYVRYGDFFSKICLLLGILPVVAAAGERMRKRIFKFQDAHRPSDDE